MKNIIIADDDDNVLKLVKIHLQEIGYNVFIAKNGIEALSIIENNVIDIAIFDIMMPFLDGFSLTKKVRQKNELPIILLTAKGEIDDKEKGFKAGADDYLVKPFEPKELQFRIEALLRREKQSDSPTIKIGNVYINKNNYNVYIGERTILLPLKEFELLAYLAENANQVFSRDQLIEQVWGIDFQGDNRTVDVHIKRLRDRFSNLTKEFEIKTVRGIGYLLEETNK